MAKRPTVKPLGELLRTVIQERRLSAWCEAAGLRPHTVANLIDGKTKPYRATVIALAAALKMPEEDVRAACEASRAASK